MNERYAPWSEWHYEPADPSVGIMEPTYYHEQCPLVEDHEAATVTESSVDFHLRCKCGAFYLDEKF